MSWQSGDEHWTHRYPERVGRGPSAPGAALTEDQIEEICLLYTQFDMPRTEIGERYGVSRVTVWRHLKARGLI